VGTVPTTLVYVTGQVVTAAQLNGNPGGTWGPFLLGTFQCQARQTVSQNLATGVWTAITLDTEDQDTDFWHSVVANTHQIKPQTPGWIRVQGMVSFPNAATGRRGARLTLNGTPIPGSRGLGAPTGIGGPSVVTPVKTVQVNGSTDWVSLEGFQDSGGTLATDVGVSESQPAILAEWRGTQ
jgi:hypothetical protein